MKSDEVSPPFEGGETLFISSNQPPPKYYARSEFHNKNPFAFIDPPCKTFFRLLNLTAMPPRGAFKIIDFQ